MGNRWQLQIRHIRNNTASATISYAFAIPIAYAYTYTIAYSHTYSHISAYPNTNPH